MNDIFPVKPRNDMHSNSGIRVLLIEDDVAFANLVRLQLSKVKPKVVLDPAVSLARGLSNYKKPHTMRFYWTWSCLIRKD